jgi:hypothetical protein
MSKYQFTTYVVELDPAVLNHGRVRKANPKGSERCVYVGSTAHTPEHRYDQHKAGVHANRGYVTTYGVGLRQDLADGQTYTTRQDAERAEAQLAAQLRKEGYTVWSR